LSKKRFTEGLESLFSEAAEDAPRKERRQPARRDLAPGPEVEAESKDAPGKGFSSELHAFLQDAFNESFEEQLTREKRGGARPARQAPSGLDALIRNTLSPETLEVDPDTSRRLVVTFREAQLQKLKTIAKLKKTYLKEIIHEIVEDFIERYEKNKGGIP
jgi:hypothetical protein